MFVRGAEKPKVMDVLGVKVYSPSIFPLISSLSFSPSPPLTLSLSLSYIILFSSHFTVGAITLLHHTSTLSVWNLGISGLPEG